MFSGKISHFFMGLGGFRVFRRNIMIHNKDNFIFICNPGMVELMVIHINRQMSGTIITHHSVKGHRMNIIGFDHIHTGSPGNYFFP